ncbi:MAG: acetamidase/formamidase family protein [Treponema sp.]|jgi:acetamidase/formamidase|nr:acetamidase/formamidase family protein [Treponema sp.]
MKTLSRVRENAHFYIDAQNEPRLRVEPGESFCLETIRADNMFLSRDRPFFRDHREVMEVLANPVTGPVYVEGAEPGDRLEVLIEDIRLGDSGNEGYYTYVPGQGLFANRFVSEVFPPDTCFCKVSGDTFQLRCGSGKFELKTEPFIGTICVAMKGKVSLSYDANREMVGNVDCPNIKKGSAVIMPVNVPGALLSLGDLHAKQGDGELLGCALESDGAVNLSVNLIKKGDPRFYELPQVNGDGRVGSICTVPNNIEAAVKGAVYDVIKRLEAALKIPFMEAYMIAGLCIKIQICQMITGACTAYAYVDNPIFHAV